MFVFRIQQAWKHLTVVLDHSRPCAAAPSRRQPWGHLVRVAHFWCRRWSSFRCRL